MPQSRSIHLHKDQPEPIGDILHQRRFAIAWRTDQKQQSHSIRSLVFANRPHLFGQIVSHTRQVDFVNQLIANEAGQHFCFEFVRLDATVRFRDEPAFGRLQRFPTRYDMVAIQPESLTQLMVVERDGSIRNLRVVAAQA